MQSNAETALVKLIEQKMSSTNYAFYQVILELAEKWTVVI